MKRLVILSAALLVGVVTYVVADDAAKTKAAKTAELSVEQKLGKIDEELAEAREKIGQEYAKAKTEADKQKLVEDYQTLAKSLTAKYAAIVKESPDDPATIRALQFLITQPGETDGAVDVLIKHHIE